jgi:hypothetical protein
VYFVFRGYQSIPRRDSGPRLALSNRRQTR